MSTILSQVLDRAFQADIAANPGASEEEIQAESVRLGRAIQGREGNDGIISDS